MGMTRETRGASAGASGPAMGAAASDAEIVRRVRAGEVALFEVLMRRHNPRIYRAARSVLRDEAEVEDAMQQAYLQAYLHLGEFQGKSSFSTWLVRITLNEALGRLRRRERLVSLEDLPDRADGDATADLEDTVAAREAMTLLQNAIDRLPVHHRTVYVLREVDELSTEETAQALDVSEDVVKVRLHRARLALRDLLAEEAGLGAKSAYPFLAPRCDSVVAAVMAGIAGRRSG